jgi:prepilin-type N-terminal cleavage/methylation domain-containing protein
MSVLARLESSDRGGQDEAGFTLIELMVTLAVLALIVGLLMGFIVELVQQSTNVRETMLGVEQDQIAGEGLVQYLHAATVVLPGSNATALEVSILAGEDSTDTPEDVNVGAVLSPPSSSGLDSVFTTSVTPAEGTGTQSSINDYDAVPVQTISSVTTTSGSTTVSLSSGGFTDVLTGMNVTGTGIAIGTTVKAVSGNRLTLSVSATASGSVTLTFGQPFIYYYSDDGALSSTMAPTYAEMSQVVAVGINVTFLAGPEHPTGGYKAVRPTSFRTTVSLQNSLGDEAPVTTTSLSYSGTLGIGDTLTITAAVSPVPDGGTVGFTATQGGSSVSVCTSLVEVDTSSGDASCSFTPSAAGTYDFVATYSGTNDYEPSDASTLAVVVPYPTTTSIGSLTLSGPSGSRDTITVPVTVSSTNGTPTGTVNFNLSVCRSSGSNCTTYSGSGTLSSGQTTWSQPSLTTKYTYNVSATYAGNASYAGSTSASSTGNLP